MKAEILVGVSASGKSTYANDKVRQHHDWIKLDRDDLRFSLTGARSWREFVFDKKLENVITNMHNNVAMSKKFNLIIAETNLTAKNRNKWVETLQTLGYDVKIVEFPISFEEAIARDSKRQYSVGKSVIEKQYKQWITYQDGKHAN